MKEKISLYLVAVLKRIAALWVGYLVAIVPLYILRGNYHDMATLETLENILLAATASVVSPLLLFFLYRTDDHAARLDSKGVLALAVVPSVIHLLCCVLLCWSKYVYILLSGAFSFACLLSPGADSIVEQPIWSVLVASVIATAIPAIGVYLGCRAAGRKRQKEIAMLHGEGENKRN